MEERYEIEDVVDLVSVEECQERVWAAQHPADDDGDGLMVLFGFILLFVGIGWFPPLIVAAIVVWAAA